MMYVSFSHDIPTGPLSGHGGIAVPPELESVDLSNLRLVDGDIIDVSGWGEFWIDALGQKHAVPGDGWQHLACRLTDIVVSDGGIWRVGTAAEAIGAALIAYLARRRWEAETGGTVWNGWPLPTDDRSQSKYLAELAAVNEGVRQDGQPWKFDHGFEALTNQQVREMAVAARGHVLACFAREAEVAVKIATGAITTAAEIDAAFEVLAAAAVAGG